MLGFEQCDPQNSIKEAAKIRKSYFLNSSAIKALPPPPPRAQWQFKFSLKKSNIFLNGKPPLPPVNGTAIKSFCGFPQYPHLIYPL